MRAAAFLLAALFLAAGWAPPAHAASQTVSYLYDDLGRMTHAIYDSSWVLEYTWDDNGNLLQREVKAFTVEVPPGPGSAHRFWLGPAAPNPFDLGTQIRFSLAERTYVRLDLYDVAGRHVRTLVKQELGPGGHTAEWDGLSGSGRRAASNVYFYVLRAGTFEATRQIILMR
jgi:YD repeat-containing protein